MEGLLDGRGFRNKVLDETLFGLDGVKHLPVTLMTSGTSPYPEPSLSTTQVHSGTTLTVNRTPDGYIGRSDVDRIWWSWTLL